MKLQRILVVKLADVGDLLMISPALTALRRAHPDAWIDVLAPPKAAATLAALPHIDGSLLFDKFGFDRPAALLNPRRWAEGLSFARQLRAARYDAVAVMHHLTTRFGGWKFAALALVSGAKIRAGLDNGRGWFLTHRYLDAGFGALHEAAYWQQVAVLLGADPTPLPLAFTPGLADIERAGELLRPLLNIGGPLVAIHPGTGGYAPARRWPAGYFAQLARRLHDALDARIVIVGGADVSQWATRIIESAALVGDPRTLNLSEQTTLGELGAVLARCNLYIGSDSGPLHIATTSGVPVLGIYGPSNHRAWGPYVPGGAATEFDALTVMPQDWPQPAGHAMLRQSLACSPCLYREHAVGLRNGCPPRECLDMLTPDAAFAAARLMLAGRLFLRPPV
ncbi:MAG: glycosyl transferase [Candidatus Chloroheliales bacterium]|nr:MAG: glycosyl transferase [Chloroflexota bacterium]